MFAVVLGHVIVNNNVAPMNAFFGIFLVFCLYLDISALDFHFGRF